MIHFKNFDQVINELTEQLSTYDHPKCWNVVIPPCHYSSHFSLQLRERLRKSIGDARVAYIAADAVHSPREFVAQVHHEWTGERNCPVGGDALPNILLSELLNLFPNGRNILIIAEFHKILGRMDERILVALRTAEQAGRIHTIAVSIYPHKWLREKWKKEGHLLTVSNYGDHHNRIGVEPYSYEDLEKSFDGRNFPRKLVEVLYAFTGGIPECMDHTMGAWQSSGSPSLTFETQAALRETAITSMERFAKYIDPEGSSKYSSLIMNLHRHIDEAQSYSFLSKFHPWSHIILDGDGLRIDTLGDALTRAELEKAFKNGTITGDVAYNADLAIRYYNLGQYCYAIETVRRYRSVHDNPRLHLIELHARLMQELNSGMSGEVCPNPDTEWAEIRKLIEDARSVLRTVLGNEEDRRVEIALDRYRELEQLAQSIRVARKGHTRFLDFIGGMHGGAEDKEATFALVVYQYESANRIPGNVIACKVVNELPEQIIRLWGLWKHGANYYSAPNIDGEVFSKLQDTWPPRFDTPNVPPQGKPFPSILLYCYFLFALENSSGGSMPTWLGEREFQSEMSNFETRNDIAHASVVVNAKTRAKLFALISTWIDRLERDCMGPVSRESVLAKVRPLDVY